MNASVLVSPPEYSQISDFNFYSASEVQIELPITHIMGAKNIYSVQKQRFLTEDKLLLCYRIAVKSLHSCINAEYVDFDAHTTANCCHGMTTLVVRLLSSVSKLNLGYLLNQSEKLLSLVERGNISENSELFDWTLPWQIIHLSQLYVLAFTTEKNADKGRRTIYQKLTQIAPIGKSFCNDIVKNLQHQFANIVAESYANYLPKNEELQISGAPVQIWGRYVRPEFLRQDRRGTRYAPCMFSMQVVLAHLGMSQTKVLLLNDLLSRDGIFKDRYARLLEGDNERFRVVESEEWAYLKETEPVAVFAGCSYSDNLTIESLTEQIAPWVKDFSRLVLACDAYYPHFPRVLNDTQFDSSSIIPEEDSLKNLIEDARSVQGVSSEDPSLFCLAHIYPASVKQALEILQNTNPMVLPQTSMPGILLS
jgi:hypothetical protein